MKLTRILMALAAAAALIAVDGNAVAQPKDKEQKEHGANGKEKKAKQHQHRDGKALLGDRIKTNGKHKLEQRGKNTAFATVQNGKIAGMSVTNADKGELPVKKYKTNKKMAESGGLQAVSMHLAQQSVGTTWIGYSYIDEYGDEIIYWYEYEMILDGDTGAVDYVPVY